MIPTRAEAELIFSFSPMPLSCSGVLGGLRFRLFFPLAPLFLIVVDHPLSEPTFLDPAHHVPEPLVNGRVVENGPDGPLSAVNLSRDGLEVRRSLFKV